MYSFLSGIQNNTNQNRILLLVRKTIDNVLNKSRGSGEGKPFLKTWGLKTLELPRKSSGHTCSFQGLPIFRKRNDNGYCPVRGDPLTKGSP